MNRVLLLIFALGLMAVVVSVFWPEIHKRRQLESEYSKALAKLESRRDHRNQLAKKENLLRNDPSYIETIARDRIGVSKPGERIIRIERPTDGSVPTVQVQPGG